jgi:hypothetical protein
MVSESNRGGADRTTAAGEERGQLLFDVPEIRFTKLFINGSFVDAVSGTCTVLPSLAPTPVQNGSLLVPDYYRIDRSDLAVPTYSWL